MSIAAAPRYLGNDFSQASPGLRFGMYLKLWGVNSRSHEQLWTTHDINYRVAGKDRQEREFKDENKVSALNEAKRVTPLDKATMEALATRQSTLAATVPDNHLLRLEALATAPFTTGLGNEHPLENGFAFLNPYGLPYLPGSGVKGVLRQAARELASGDWGETHGWDDVAINALFGKEDSNNAQRGALAFWDVIPQIKGNSLAVEIMTPHQSHYYQNGGTPHDSGHPIPISFLTVPPGSGFAFHVVCDLVFLRPIAPSLVGNWKTRLTAAFEHAFQWLGFGAKTAVGYGAMHEDPKVKARRAAQEAEAARKAASEAEAIAQADAAARRQAEFAALPESEQAFQRLDKGLARFEGPTPLNQDRYGELVGLLNEFAEQARTWIEPEVRDRAASRLEAVFERFGWAPAGLKRDKREKQERKRRDLIGVVRQGIGQP